MIDLRAHGLSGGAESAWGIAERHDVEAAVDWIKSRGFQAASIGALGASLGAFQAANALSSPSRFGMNWPSDGVHSSVRLL